MTATGDIHETVIRIDERGQDGGSFLARVSFGNSAEYDVEVVDPADPTEEAHLAWYFQEHLRYPFLDKDLETQAVQHIAAYGEKLFSQVFGGIASYDYRKLRSRAFDRCRVEVSGSAALHRLHWEALRDPALDTPLAIRLPVTRRIDAQESKFELPSGRPTLNILVVTARPDGPKDIGYRTISRPLLDALRMAGLPVTVDLVRPGTWEALRAHLRSATERYGSGWYQVLHFDLHGSFSEYAPLEEALRAGRLLFSSTSLAPFEGHRGFLFFETAQEGKARPVPAEDVAGLLAEHRVPVAVLNACQSAMQTASEAGLAQRLAEAGLPVAVGMAYSVTVSAAERAMPVLYGRIADGTDLTAAVHAARRDLFEHQGRQAYFSQQIDLEDWMLPVMFVQQPLQIGLRPMTGQEQAEFFGHIAIVGDEPDTEYGFVGRDLDIQTIEHRLLAGSDSNELLVQGMAGAGKTTLLTHLAWWWQRTGLVDRVFRFTYEDRAWTSGQIVREIRSQLLPPGAHAEADTMTDAAQVEQIAQLLRSHRHLLIIDNAESITATPAAIPHALSSEEQHKLKTFLSRLRGGRTMVLLGSREHETWLATGSSGPGVYPLPGLDPQAASTLTERILNRHGAGHYLVDGTERGALQELVALLGGYPLPLTVVLPALAASQPSAVVAELKAGGEGADPAGLIRRAIEYSYGKLDPGLQASLLALAPFTSVIPTGPMLDHYRNLLSQEEMTHGLDPVDLEAALRQAVAVGLASSHPQIDYLIRLQPVLPYFLRSRLHDQPALRAATSHAHYQLYYELAMELYRMLLSRDSPEKRKAGQVIIQAEYPNLAAALAYALGTSQPISVLIGALDEYLDQAKQHGARRELLESAISIYPNPANEVQQRELCQLYDLAGSTALAQRRLDDARSHYETELQLIPTDSHKQLGITYHQLGIIAELQRRFADAETNYHKALDAFTEIDDRYETAGVYGQLGALAAAQRQYADAEANYRIALDIKLEFDDRSSAAITHNNLAMVLRHQKKYSEAESNYRKALDIYLEFGDRGGAGAVYYNLGVLALEQRQAAKAEVMVRHALNIYLEIDDRYETAGVYALLASIAIDQRRYAGAESNYGRALDIYLEFDDQYHASVIYHNLGVLAARQQNYAEAAANYRKALDIRREADSRTAPETAMQLGAVLAMLNQHSEAIHMVLYAALAQHSETGQWPEEALQWLHRERGLISSDEFTRCINSEIPTSYVKELAAAIEEAENPSNTDEPGTKTSSGDTS
jgi:tetratricopeptide (TPR) repeat protein